MTTWRDNTLGKTTATLAGSTRMRVITDPTGTPLSQQTSLDALLLWLCREKLTAARTYYVRTDGSDSNTGLANTSGGAFLTIQKAVNVALYEIDARSHTVTIQVGAGTYTETISAAVSSNNNVIIVGDETTPANCLVNGASASASFSVSNLVNIAIRGFKVANASGSGLLANGFGAISFQNMDFGACAANHVFAQGSAATLTASGNYSITGNANRHWYTSRGGTIIAPGRTITLTGTPALAVGFSVAETVSRQIVNGCTFSGSATGTRYSAVHNSAIYTNGGGATYLPGSVGGSTATGGQYI